MSLTISLQVSGGGFEYADLLRTTTPEENAEILKSGCRIHIASRDRSMELSVGERAVALTRSHVAEMEKIRKETAEEKARAESAWKSKEEALTEAARKEKQRADAEATLRADLAARLAVGLAEETTRARDMTRASVQAELDAAVTRAAAAMSKAADAEAAKSRVVDQAAAAEKAFMRAEANLKAQIAEAHTIKERAVATEKQKADASALAAEKAKAQEVALARVEEQGKAAKAYAELKRELDVAREQAKSVAERKANSSLKGADNEEEWRLLLDATFGHAVDYKYLEKHTHMGDHSIVWEGKKLMIENKKGYTESALRGPQGLPKSHKLFNERKDFDGLVFVAEDVAIPDHSRAGDISIERDSSGRPMIYIGRFADKPKETMITAVLIPLLRIIPELRGGDEREEIVGKLSKLQSMCERHVTSLNGITSGLNKFCQMVEQQSGLLKTTVKSAAAIFQMEVMAEFIPKEKATVVEGAGVASSADLKASIASGPALVDETPGMFVSAPVAPSVPAAGGPFPKCTIKRLQEVLKDKKIKGGSSNDKEKLWSLIQKNGLESSV